MTKLAMTIGILATVFCWSVRAQTVSVMTLDQAGAQTVLQAARESAQQRNAPSAIAVVDPAGDLLAFQRMDGVRPASVDLAIEKRQAPSAEQLLHVGRHRSFADDDVGIDEVRRRFRSGYHRRLPPENVRAKDPAMTGQPLLDELKRILCE